MNLTDRLITEIVGKCDGLSITAEQASNILAYLQYGAPMDTTTTNTGAASLSDAFETLIDIYQDAQNGGTAEQRAAARGALKAAFKSALMCSSASRAAPSPQADAAPLPRV